MTWYYCKKCQGFHNTDTEIGKKHIRYAEDGIKKITKRKSSKYMMLKKIGESISYKRVWGEFTGGEKLEPGKFEIVRIGGFTLKELKGAWWAVPDDRIDDKDFLNSKSGKVNNIFVTLGGSGYLEDRNGRINRKSETAYITFNQWESLF